MGKMRVFLLTTLAGVGFAAHCSQQHCTNEHQKASASAFCSSFQSVGTLTRTSYPHFTSVYPGCCEPCAVAAQPPPTPTTTTTTTKTTSPPSIPRPSCLDSATGVSSMSRECDCLSLTSATTTVTYTETLAMTGPFLVSVAARGVWFTETPLPDGNRAVKLTANESDATKFWVGSDDSLFNHYPPEQHFSIQSFPSAKPTGPYPALQIPNPPVGVQYDRLVCPQGLPSGLCSLNCGVFNNPLNEGPTYFNLGCNDTWELGDNYTAKHCRPLEMLDVHPVHKPTP